MSSKVESSKLHSHRNVDKIKKYDKVSFVDVILVSTNGYGVRPLKLALHKEKEVRIFIARTAKFFRRIAARAREWRSKGKRKAFDPDQSQTWARPPLALQLEMAKLNRRVAYPRPLAERRPLY